MKFIYLLMAILVIAMQLTFGTPVHADQTTSANQNQIIALLAMIAELREQLKDMQQEPFNIKLTGQVISAVGEYTKTVNSKPNDLIVLRWSTQNLQACTLTGPAHPKKVVAVSGIVEVRAPQSGDHTYTLNCKQNSKNISSDLIIKTQSNTSDRFMEIMVKHPLATKNEFKAQDIVVKPRTKFDLKWKTEGYEICWFKSDRDVRNFNVKQSGTSEGWIASDSGEAIGFALTCMYSSNGERVEDTRVLNVLSTGNSDKG